MECKKAVLRLVVPLSDLENKDCDKLVIEGISDYNVTKMIC